MIIEIVCLICFLGKILDDAKRISEYKIEEKNFVVIMVAKVSVAQCSSTSQGSFR